jgi:O-antigen/teichoic acid export membrane protein
MLDFYHKIRENATYLILQKLFTPLINLALTIYIIRKLTITDYGIYNLLYAIISYMALYSSMGLLNVFQRYVPEYYTRHEYGRVKSLFISGFAIRFILSVIFITILLSFGDLTNRFFKVENLNEYIEFFALGIILFLEVQIVEVTLGSLLLNKLIMISYLVSTIIRAGLIVIFLEKDMGFKGLLLAETCFYGLLLLLQIVFYYLNFSSRHSSSEKSLPFKRLLRYSGFSYLDELGWTILDVKTDFFVISTFLGPTMVGLYAFANQVIESVAKVMPDKMIRPLIRTVFFSKFSEQNDVQQLNRHFNLLIKIIAFISFPLFFVVLALGYNIIIYFYDVKYLPALNLLWIFTWFLLIISFQFPLQLVVQAVERVEITFYSKIFSIYNLIAEILIIKTFGLPGVALITCSARLFQSLFIFYRIRKFVPIKIDFQALKKIFFNSLVMMGGLLLLKGFINSVAELIIVMVLAFIFYLVLSFINKSFLGEEREVINKLLPRPIFVF